MTKEAWIVFDLGFGDAGKGATVDFLVRERGADLVVRHHGGGQAGHNVVTPEGVHHTFSQFGAGTFVPGTRTLLGPAFVFHPGGFWNEAMHLESLGIADAWGRVVIDARARVISPFQQASGRLRELLRGDQQHGTCGVGVGEAVMDSIHYEQDTIRAGDFANRDLLVKKLQDQQRRKQNEFEQRTRYADTRAISEYELLSDSDCIERILEQWRPVIERLNVVAPDVVQQTLKSAKGIVFEGAQGILLDQNYGFHPHTTWSDCTCSEALSLIESLPLRVFRLGVLRSYMIRHGTGPFPTNDSSAEDRRQERHNQSGGWQGRVRIGPLDLVLLRYALAASKGADGLALTHLDDLPETARICHSYRMNGQTIQSLPLPDSLEAQQRLTRLVQDAEPVYDVVPREDLLKLIERRLEVPIHLISAGPTFEDRQFRQHL